jgi:dipeptidyl aminopeptidase/acylaminoacyl peptidase
MGSKRPMTFADLQRMKRVSDPQISPSGRWVMFSVTDVDLEKNSKVNHLWVMPMGAPEAAGGASATAVAKERQVTFWKEGESGGRFSPDGKKVLFTATDEETGRSQIFLAPWDESAGTLGTPQRLTSVSTEADGAEWSPNSKRILFTSRVYPECSDEASWVDEDNCDKRKDEAAAASPVKAQIWDHLLYRHWNGYVGPKRSHVLVVSASDGNAVRDLTPRRDIGDAEAPTFSLGGPTGYAWAPGSEEIAYVTNLDLVPAASTNNDVFTLLLDDKGARPRKISSSMGSDDGPAYSPDGKYIAFRSQARAGYESDRFRLMVFDRVAGTTRELMPKFDRWVDEFVWGPAAGGGTLAAPKIAGGAGTIYFASGEHGQESLYSISMAPGGEIKRLTESGEFSSAVISPDGMTAVVAGMTVDHPTEIFAVGELNAECGSGDGEWPAGTAAKANACLSGRLKDTVQLSHMNDALLNTLDLGAMESFWFAGAEGARVQGFLIRPPHFDETKRYPLKFLIHGGPQGAWGDAWSYRWNPELMAASGYVVVMVNPRGSTGYGQAFIDGINGDWGGKAYVDLMKGLDYAEKSYPFIDKGRECALGASYGGYMADWILTHTDRFACIVTHDGMFNPQSAYGTTEELWFNEWEFRSHDASGAPEAAPGQPWRYFDRPVAQDPFRKWSPMLSIKNAKTPTLVIHSQRDYRLDVSEGFQLFTALQRLNVPSKMLYFPDEGHWVLKPQNSKLWYETVGAWCDRWTRTVPYAVSAAPVVRTPTPARVSPAKVQSVAPVPAPAPVVRAPAPVASAAAAPAEERSADFTVAISAPQDEVSVGGDARILIALRNVSDHQVLFGHRPGTETPEFSYRIEVKDAAGRVVAPTERGREALQHQAAEDRMVDYVQPGKAAVQTAHLAKLVNLSRPGRYTVRVYRRDPVSGVVVRSNELTLNVVP